VATLTGVAPHGVRQGDYLLKGFEHLCACGTVAPGAVGRAFGAAIELVDSATRADHGVGIGRYRGLLSHRIPFSSTCPWFLNLVLFERFSLLPLGSPCCFAFHPVGAYEYEG
jgi:hypothetical protein